MKAGDLSSAQSDSRLGKGTHAQMGPRITVEFLSKTIADKAWEFGNQVLYDMCRLHPDHKQDEIIIGKIWLIGRTYAAAIERRRSIGDSVGDAFYEDIVAPKIRRSEIDVLVKLAPHRQQQSVNGDVIGDIRATDGTK